MIVLAGFEVDALLHESANTRIYRGVRRSDGARLVFKVPCVQTDAGARARVVHEHALLTTLQSEGVVRCAGLETYQGLPVLLLEDSGMQSLREQRGETPMSIDAFLDFALEVTAAVGRIHEAGIVHKDLNPANILWDPAIKKVSIIDFGTATRLPRETQEFRGANLLVGTLAYLSPEQTGRMNRAIDYRTDFYALGMTFYELLTGRHAFTGKDAMELVHCHIAKTPASPSELRPEIPEALSSIVLKLVAKMAESRYQSAHGLLEDLRWVRARLDEGASSVAFVAGSRDVSQKFQLPQKLYGREREIAQLLEAFERVSEGQVALVTVSGYSGIGKSLLVSEVHKPIVRRRGYFASGKFDQFKRDVPCDAVIQALRQLCRDILLEPPAKLEAWKRAIVEHVGLNAAVLTAALPEAEVLVGKQPPPQVVGASEGQARLTATFRSFIGVFGKLGHPVVVFLDDLQWADSGSLELLEAVATNSDASRILLIGAYRDNEVDAAHPLRLVLDKIAKIDAVPVTNIVVEPLGLGDVEQLVADTLWRSTGDVAEFASVLHDKTHGNPFFLSQLLVAIHQRGLIRFDSGSGQWQWDLSGVLAVGMTDNVVDLMISRIARVSSRTQRILQVAACVGNRFDLDVISVTQERSAEETAADLWDALREGFILPSDGASTSKGASATTFRFSHDRVQQAAYAMVPEDERASLRLGIGRLLARDAEDKNLGAAVFDVIGHYIAGAALLTESAEREQVARLALSAGTRARSALAYKSAETVLSFGMSLLSSDAWSRTYDLAYGLHMELAQSEFLLAKTDLAAELFTMASERGQTLADKVNAYLVRITLEEMAGRFEKALMLGVEALALFGVNLNFAPTDDDVQALLDDVHRVLDGRAPADLASLPEMTDPEHVALAMSFMSLTATSYFVSPNFFATVILRALVHAIEHGRTPVFPIVATCTGLLLMPRGFVEQAYAYGKLGYELAMKEGVPPIQARACFHFGDWIRRAKGHPMRENQEYLKKAFLYTLEAGDLNWGCFSACHLVANDFVLGSPLAESRTEAARWIDYTDRMKSPEMTDCIVSIDRAFMTLMGLTKGTSTYDDAHGFDEAAYEAMLIAQRSKCAQAYYHHHRAAVQYIFGNFRAAFETDLKTSEVIWALHSQLKIEEHVFYHAMIQLGAYAEASESERETLLEKAREGERKLRFVAEHAPCNYEHKRLLVSAELARVLGRVGEAAELYDEAIERALADGWVNIAAIACDCALRFHVARGRPARARGYLQEGLAHFGAWGATAKVKELTDKYRALLPAARASSTVGGVQSTLSSAHGLDLVSVTKASQVISSEIRLDRLLHTLTRIVLENAGAERGFIILERGGKLFVEASGDHDDASVTIRETELDKATELCTAVVSYVARTKQPVVLENAAAAGAFAADPYIADRGTKSLLCLPIVNQSRLVGLVYLENNLSVGCFDVDRLTAVRVLVAQMGISIENATLYASLEDKVRERTEALHRRERAIQLILDSTGDGLLSVRLDGTLAAEPSRAALEWFGPAPKGTSAATYLGADESYIENFAAALSQVSDDILPFEISAAQMPSRLEREGRTFELFYRQVFEDGVFARILVVVRDVTRAVEAQRAQAEALEKQEIVARLLADRDGVERYVAETRQLLSALASETELAVAKRLLHTLKGNSAIFGFSALAKACHDLETEIASDERAALTKESVAVLSAYFADRLESIHEYLAIGERDGLSVHDDELTSALRLARVVDPTLASILESWRWRRSADYLKTLGQQSVRTAERLGKRIAIAVNDNGLRVDPRALDPFFGALVHVVRNAIDHGVEDTGDRLAQGKPAEGRIGLTTRVTDTHLVVEVSDDGRGIDVARLALAAGKRGLTMRGPEDAAAVLFADGVSTRDEVTDLSGRGVGLSAARAACEVAGGQVGVSWKEGEGTTFCFELPLALARAPGAPLLATMRSPLAYSDRPRTRTSPPPNSVPPPAY